MPITYCAWCNEQAEEDVRADHGVTYHRECYMRREEILVRFGPKDLLPIGDLTHEQPECS